MTSNGSDPFAWAGLLKWSLNYVDGTSDSKDVTPMSEEDKAFLEKVMKEGIIDEGERMTFILTEATKAMEYYKSNALRGGEGGDPPISDDGLEDLLQELRDIVEQIDYARAFCSLKGLPFLIGCIAERTYVPEPIRLVCVGILSTLSQNNPPVQKELLELGAVKTLSYLFFLNDTSQSMKAKIMQAMGSIVRNDELAENVFCSLEQSHSLFLQGLDPKSATPQLRIRTLFFLRALITSDHATSSRAYDFQRPIELVADNYLTNSTPDELREMSIAFLKVLLEQQKGVNIILKRKNQLASLGEDQVSTLRQLTGERLTFYEEELRNWEDFLVLLAKATPQEATKGAKPVALGLES